MVRSRFVCAPGVPYGLARAPLVDRDAVAHTADGANYLRILLPDLLRRVAALTLVSAVGIALLAPLTLATDTSDAPETQALIDAAQAPAVVAARGSVSQRDAISMRLASRLGANRFSVEHLDGAALPTPASAPMEATLFSAATPPPAPVTTAAAPAAPPPSSGPFVVDEATWDRLAQCESGGNWAINTGNGYYGGLQFDLSTWASYGGTAFAERPDLATREQQITVAEALYAKRGFQPWPACRIKLGLP